MVLVGYGHPIIKVIKDSLKWVYSAPFPGLMIIHHCGYIVGISYIIFHLVTMACGVAPKLGYE